MNISNAFERFLKDPMYIRLLNQQKKCHEENVTHSYLMTDKYNENGVWCPRTYDGMSCWDATPAGITAYQSCPKNIVGYDPSRSVYKTCTDDGTWFLPPGQYKPWTNYSTCVDMEDLDFRTFINNLYVVGYCLSVVALLLAVFVFLFFRALHCIRIRIHIQLFMSFILNNIHWIIWYRTVANQASVVQENTAWCQYLHIITYYFMVTSYLWMFCEGLHLHIALVVVFIRDDVAMHWFMTLGWGLSLLIVMVYACVRFFISGATERCWMEPCDATWIIEIPVGLSLMISLVSLVNVVRIMVVKLRVRQMQQGAAARKAVRATLILIPLFGLHYILLPLRPLPGSPWEKTYEVVSALIISLQGLFLAILYCFTNNEVVEVVKAYIARNRANNEGIPMTGNAFPLAGPNRG